MSRGDYRLFYIFSSCCVSSIGRVGARKKRRVILLRSVGCVPPALRPSGACLSRGTRVSFSLVTPSRMTPNRGGASSDAHCKLPKMLCQSPDGHYDCGARAPQGVFDAYPGPVFTSWHGRNDVLSVSEKLRLHEGLRVPCLAIAHMKPTNARAMATTTGLACVPLASRRR
jgi:hypothetical protein